MALSVGLNELTPFVPTFSNIDGGWFDRINSQGLNLYIHKRVQVAPTGSATYYLLGAASIFSMTRAREPRRSKTFPLTITRCPANFTRRRFWPVAGAGLRMGQQDSSSATNTKG